MKYKNLIALSIAAALPVFAQAETPSVEVYGKINVSLQADDLANGDTLTELVSNASRFGLKGKSAISDSLEVFYKLEWEVDVTDKSKGSDNNIQSRNQIVGLKGNFGKVFVGRHDTPTKALQNKIDLFNDYTGDIKHIFNGENRASNILQYSTPKFGDHFQANIAVIPGESPSTGNDGIADGTSASITYHAKDLYLGLSNDADVDGQGIDTTRFAAQYNLEKVQLGFIYETTDNSVDTQDGFLVSAAYKMDSNTFKIQYADSDIWKLGISSKIKYKKSTSLGIDHKLSKEAKVFAWYTVQDLGASNGNDSALAIGMEYKF
ncbi:MAG: porin [Gammaproteobacteria bacterium CG22_combo_CG10-13_8_21_14_all_40_8]|nr:MAG: porin [Gammaproteobacteria bacterium CG22_combo_CG10-13_8_21_14_all_40_8]